MKTLFTAAIVLTLSGTAFAGAEVPADTIPGFSVTPAAQSSQQLASINSEVRSESLAYTVPGYGVTSTGIIGSQTEVGSVEVDYLGQSFEGAF